LSGPSLKRGGQKQQSFEGQYGMGSFQAPLPQLTPQTVDLLNQFLTNPQQAIQGIQPTSDLQKQLGNTFSQLVSGMAPERQTETARGILGAAQPVFQQNLQRGADVIRQGGPRFASAANQQIGDLTQRSLNDFNLFAQQALQTQQGLDLQGLAQATQFDQGVTGQNLQMLLPFLQMGMLAGGAQSAAPLVQDPGFMGNVMAPLLQLGSLAVPFLGPGGAAAGAAGAATSLPAINTGMTQAPLTAGGTIFRSRPNL
jgi:hypothetical protein